jgi:hypothetical protein
MSYDNELAGFCRDVEILTGKFRPYGNTCHSVTCDDNMCAHK